MSAGRYSRARLAHPRQAALASGSDLGRGRVNQRPQSTSHPVTLKNTASFGTRVCTLPAATPGANLDHRMNAPSSPPPDQPARQPDASALYALADVVSTVMAVAVGGSAAVVAALGQFALAVVLAVVALGIVLRLWRTRRRRRAAGAAKGF